jgi:hypothetical protein
VLRTLDVCLILIQFDYNKKNGSIFVFAKITGFLLELGTTRGISDIIDLDAVSSIDLRIDLEWLENPDVSFVFFHEDFVHHISLVNRVEDVGRRLRSELCGTDEQHRMIYLNT